MNKTTWFIIGAIAGGIATAAGLYVWLVWYLTKEVNK